MYVLTVRDHFDAAHSLRGYAGECSRLHGHTWDVEVSVEGRDLDGVGILYDFKRLKAELRAVLDDYDHRNLDETGPFDGMNATAENLARTVFERLAPVVDQGVRLTEVAVWESPIARLVYRPDPA
jgi:6-pyruvoyltetrahydropterin/6-carboxytetrahydropterin synthase